ncbi:hypothetical protein E4U30_007654 [Claviceps sp. LM220 group G6]|nr:hypothetical protein E4U15_007155 [Claviceps sp. LM218 group G6]KAG6091003.1 hypothetical protein E4U30_007654 [Claviceps sp. LM220 group G6]
MPVRHTTRHPYAESVAAVPIRLAPTKPTIRSNLLSRAGSHLQFFSPVPYTGAPSHSEKRCQDKNSVNELYGRRDIYAREHQTEASPSLSHGLLNIWVSTQRSSNIDLWQPTPSGLSSLFQTVNRGHRALCWLWSKPPAISLDDTRIQRWIKYV